MASFGHIAVGLSAARLDAGRFSWRHAVAFSAVSMLPDADVLGFRFGVAYGDAFGHRGATHSFAFAALCGVVALAVGAGRKTSLLVALTVATHPLLDALTDGGLGVALFFPFSLERFFFPWRPIEVAPLASGMLSARGAHVLAREVLQFLPCAVFGVWPKRRAAATVAQPAR